MASSELPAAALVRQGSAKFDVSQHRLRVRHMAIVAGAVALALVGIATLIVTAI